jgi:hypothetical protein
VITERQLSPGDGTGPPPGNHAAYDVYLGYLDKEMTIMGILSAFAVIAPAVILDRTMGATKGSVAQQLWTTHAASIIVGVVTLFAASLLFYRQRSDLAYWYGQIALSVTPAAYREPTELGHPQPETVDFIHEADLWSSWHNYWWAFAFMIMAGLIFVDATIASWWPGSWVGVRSPTLVPVACTVVLVYFTVRHLVFNAYAAEYAPWKCVGRKLFASLSIKRFLGERFAVRE